MKVLYDYAAFAMQPRGGVSRVMYELARYGLRNDDVECAVWSGVHQNHAADELKKRYPTCVHGVKIPESWAKQRILMPLNKRLFPLYSRHFNPDICHYTFFMTPSVPSHTRTVITVHDLINELFPQHYNPRDQQAVLRREALQKASGVVCVSKHTRDDLLRLYDLDKDRVIVAYNGNSMEGVRPLDPKLAGPFILYVGDRRGWRKNFDVVLECLASFNELKSFSLVCFGDRAFGEKEKARFSELGLTGRILHRGGSDEALAGYYKAASALIYPSRYEGFGLPPIEAMHLGCPIVASKAPPMPEIIEGAGLFFDPESANDLGFNLLQVINDVAVKSKLVERGIKRAKLFSWERSCAEVFSFYERILERPV